MARHNRSHFVRTHPVSPVVAPVDRLQEIWSKLSTADRQVILGHDSEVLSSADQTQLVRVLRALGEQRRS